MSPSDLYFGFRSPPAPRARRLPPHHANPYLARGFGRKSKREERTSRSVQVRRPARVGAASIAPAHACARLAAALRKILIQKVKSTSAASPARPYGGKHPYGLRAGRHLLRHRRYLWSREVELALGEFLRGSPGLRQRIVIQSKCGIAEGGSIDNSREHITTAVEGSLVRVGTDRLDILLLHWADSLVEPQEVAKAFDELHRAGKVRYFAVSNHSACQIELWENGVLRPPNHAAQADRSEPDTRRRAAVRRIR